jgi:hypothetical protein
MSTETIPNGTSIIYLAEVVDKQAKELQKDGRVLTEGEIQQLLTWKGLLQTLVALEKKYPDRTIIDQPLTGDCLG